MIKTMFVCVCAVVLIGCGVEPASMVGPSAVDGSPNGKRLNGSPVEILDAGAWVVVGDNIVWSTDGH